MINIRKFTFIFTLLVLSFIMIGCTEKNKENDNYTEEENLEELFGLVSKGQNFTLNTLYQEDYGTVQGQMIFEHYETENRAYVRTCTERQDDYQYYYMELNNNSYVTYKYDNDSDKYLRYESVDYNTQEPLMNGFFIQLDYMDFIYDHENKKYIANVDSINKKLTECYSINDKRFETTTSFSNIQGELVIFDSKIKTILLSYEKTSTPNDGVEDAIIKSLVNVKANFSNYGTTVVEVPLNIVR